MLQSLRRFGLTVLFVLSVAVSSEAAIIISESAAGGSGTLVHDGQADVGSNNGGGSGNAPLMNTVVTDGNLLSDLGLLSILGVFTDNDFPGATSVNLSTLWLIGTVTGNPLPTCNSCGLLSEVNVVSDLNLPNGDQRNVLFAMAIVGTFAVPDPLVDVWGGPDHPTNSGSNIPFPPGTVQYSLSADQILFIRDRMAFEGYGVDDVRLGLSVIADGVVGTTGATNIGSVWDFEGPASVPEPATVLLLGSGMLAVGVRRLRRRTLH